MAQINLSTKQKQTYRHTEQTCGCQWERGEEEGRIGNLRLVDANLGGLTAWLSFIELDKAVVL